MCVNLVVLRKLCKKSFCFPGKFTQLAQILHDRRSWQSRQISTLDVCQQSNEIEHFLKHAYILHYPIVVAILLQSIVIGGGGGGGRPRNLLLLRERKQCSLFWGKFDQFWEIRFLLQPKQMNIITSSVNVRNLPFQVPRSFRGIGFLAAISDIGKRTTIILLIPLIAYLILFHQFISIIQPVRSH